MFDFDVGKLLVIGLVALIVIGPKELPRVLRQTGQLVGKLRRMAGEFQQQFSDALRESELDQIKKDVAEMAESAKVDMNYDMAYEAEREIREAVESKPDTGKSEADKADAAKSDDSKSAAQANAASAARPAVQNPTPENDTDSVFVNIDIPKAEEPVIHAPVREVGLEAPAPAESSKAAAQRTAENVTSKAS